MTHYFGAKAILTRLGYKSLKILYRLKMDHGLPCYLKADPRNPRRRMYYASEQMLLAWELAMSTVDRNRLQAKRDEKAGLT